MLFIVHKHLLTTPPATPTDGDRYLVPTGATGVWAGKTDQVAVRIAGTWEYDVPQIGWIGLVEDEGVLSVYTASGWSPGISV